MFERQSMEQLVNKMIRWTRGVTTRLTDFRVGSKIRTMYEATALVIEELYDKVYRSMKSIIEDNIYSIIGFTKEPATYASGTVTMSRVTPAEENYIVPAGTAVLSRANQYKAPLQYRTTADALLAVGTTSVLIPVVCTTAGKDGNVGAGEVTDFLIQPVGIESVTNVSAIMGGVPEETKEDQKSRFQGFIEANARGVLQSIEYGATLASIENTDGVVTERVQQAVAVEDLPARKGEVDVYIWNGVGDASVALKSLVNKHLLGYYDGDGNPVYGYKPAGTQVNVYTAPITRITLKAIITPEGVTVEDLKPLVEQTVDSYFGSKKLGQLFIQTALESDIKRIEGVKDVKLYVSTDSGTTYATDNVAVTTPGIIVPNKPIVYV